MKAFSTRGELSDAIQSSLRSIPEAEEGDGHEARTLKRSVDLNSTYSNSTALGETGKRFECDEETCETICKSRQSLLRHKDSCHGKATTYYHCSTQGCRYSSTGWQARKYIREDQIKEHIKNYGHYGPQSPNRKKHQKVVTEPKPLLEIPVIFECWNLDADTHRFARIIVQKRIKAHPSFDNDVDEHYLTNKDSRSLPDGLPLLSFSSAEYLQQHQRRTGHTSLKAAEDELQSLDFMGFQVDLGFDLQDVGCTNVPYCEPSMDISESQSELAHLPSLYSNFDFSLPTELMSVPFTNDTMLKPSAVNERSITPLLGEDIDSHLTTINPISQSVTRDMTFSSNNLPLSFGVEAEEYAVLDSVCDFLHPSATSDSFPVESDRQFRGFEDELNYEWRLGESQFWPQTASSIQPTAQNSTPPDSEPFKTHPSNSDSEKSLCSSCGRAFTRKADMIRHSAKHEVKAIMTCKQCPREFYRRDKLKHHEKTAHRKAPKNRTETV